MNNTAHRSIGPGQPATRTPSKHLSARALTALVLDPYLRRALERAAMGAGVGMNLWGVIAEKHPEIWQIIGGDPAVQNSPGSRQLPPRSAFLASVVIEFTERMTLVAEIAELIPRPGGERGIVIVGGHVARFVDEICVNGLHLRWPLPWPAPAWYPETLSGADLIVMGTQFQQSAAIAMDRDLGRTFADAAHALLEAGAARLA
jgi:hypothetical protein